MGRVKEGKGHREVVGARIEWHGDCIERYFANYLAVRISNRLTRGTYYLPNLGKTLSI